jgi:hypothetical protein
MPIMRDPRAAIAGVAGAVPDLRAVVRGIVRVMTGRGVARVVGRRGRGATRVGGRGVIRAGARGVGRAAAGQAGQAEWGGRVRRFGFRM